MTPTDLKYLALVCYFLPMTNGEPFDFQWCYHGAPEIAFSRVSNPGRFSPDNTPSGKRSLCVEATCMQGDDIFHEPERHIDRILSDLKREGLLKTNGEVMDVHTEVFPWAYPIYRLGYRDELKTLNGALGAYDNLLLAGRLGKFWYNNMDECIEASLELADGICQKIDGAS
jgi:protoporphyrinogen oxidase